MVSAEQCARSCHKSIMISAVGSDNQISQLTNRGVLNPKYGQGQEGNRILKFQRRKAHGLLRWRMRFAARASFLVRGSQTRFHAVHALILCTNHCIPYPSRSAIGKNRFFVPCLAKGDLPRQSRQMVGAGDQAMACTRGLVPTPLWLMRRWRNR